ncbi:MAG: class I SAM-dependent methyltransferase [Formosimonas sp.]
MEQGKASRTALGTALMRALHSRRDPLPLLDDVWGDVLVPQAVKEEFLVYAFRQFQLTSETVGSQIELLDRWLKGSPSYATVITRSRYTEDTLARAIKNGVEQYVLIGAGFDSFLLRKGQKYGALKIFEVDHPSTQQLKLQQIAAAGRTLDEGICFLPADLSKEQLSDVLLTSVFNNNVKTFFSWLGVSMYLSREANRKALQTIAACAPVGSQLVFTYLDQGVFDDPTWAESSEFVELQQLVSALGEPFLSGFFPSKLREELRDVGFELLEDMSDQEVVARYDPTGVNGLRPLPFSRIAHACVI